MNLGKAQILKKALANMNSGIERFEIVEEAVTVEELAGGKDVTLVSEHQKFSALIQPWAPQQDFSSLVKKLKTLSGKPILLANFVNPVMAEKFKRQSITFVDCAGNMNLNGRFVKGKKDAVTAQKRSRGRAFNPAGLRLIFAFFNEPDLLNVSYRNIAAKVNVAIGSIGPVLDDLQVSGYVAEEYERKFLINKKRLFERWVDAYLEKLRPKLLLGHFRAPSNDWWQSVDERKYVVQWGGEITVARQTPFLFPELTTVYCTRDDLDAFVSDCQLKEDVDGDVAIYQPFWLGQMAAEEVSPMIVYADLVDSVDPGNWDVAKTFYGEKVAKLLSED